MKTLKTLLKIGSYERREILLKQMESLDHQGKNCSTCSGKCCTFQGNSMQITPLETLDLYLYLQESNLWNEELEERLKSNNHEFRLNHRPMTGGGGLMRKTYTCPFFLFQSFGCPIPGEYKPYGCLGFNPREEGVINGEACGSNHALLEARESQAEEELNLEVKKSLDLYWEKEPIGIALLELHARVLALKLQL